MVFWIKSNINNVICWSRAGSIWPLTFGLACCAIEMMHSAMSRYDFDRFGVILRAAPKHADTLIISGTVTKKMLPMIYNLFITLNEPKWIISMGSCSNGGGCYYYSQTIICGVDALIPCDVFIPGCPPSAETLIFGILQLQLKFNLYLIYF